MSKGYAGMFWRQYYPNPVTSMVLSEVDESVQITWDIVESGITGEYELLSSVGGQSAYGLIASINMEDVGSGEETITVVDQTYDTITDMYYRLYHISEGVYSTPLDSGISLTYTVPDPLTLSVVADVNSMTLDFPLPESRSLLGVDIKLHTAPAVSGLLEGNAVSIYSGMVSSYTYDLNVSGLEDDLWHQFWVSSLTRTL